MLVMQLLDLCSLNIIHSTEPSRRSVHAQSVHAQSKLHNLTLLEGHCCSHKLWSSSRASLLSSWRPRLLWASLPHHGLDILLGVCQHLIRLCGLLAAHWAFTACDQQIPIAGNAWLADSMHLRQSCRVEQVCAKTTST